MRVSVCSQLEFRVDWFGQENRRSGSSAREADGSRGQRSDGGRGLVEKSDESLTLLVPFVSSLGLNYGLLA
jgi:hypothetical protein